MLYRGWLSSLLYPENTKYWVYKISQICCTVVIKSSQMSAACLRSGQNYAGEYIIT